MSRIGKRREELIVKISLAVQNIKINALNHDLPRENIPLVFSPCNTKEKSLTLVLGWWKCVSV